MVFGGQAFEEFVAAYLKEVRNYLAVSRLDYYRSKDMIRQVEPKKKSKQGYWSDIDVVGLKGDEAIVVSCDENCSKNVNEIKVELKYAEKYVREKFNPKTVKKMYAFAICWAPRKCYEKFIALEKKGIEVKSFIEMIEEFISKIRKIHEEHGVRGKFTDPILWAIRELDLIRTLQGEEVLPPIPEGKKYRQNICVRSTRED